MNTKHFKLVDLPIYVFDFDGVVCDSTDECMVTSWNAWMRWQGRDEFRRSVSEFEAVECKKFRTLRPRVRGAGEYYLLHRSMDEDIFIDDQNAYDNVQLQWQEHLIAFKEIFFEMRDTLRKENIDKWIDLHPVYQEVITSMKAFHSTGQLYIATMKDAESVQHILGKQGLNMPSSHLFDESQISSKVQALNMIREQVGCNKTDIIFIDDNVTHLLAPKSDGYTVLMTTWGRTLPEYIDLANQHNISMIKINDIVNMTPC